MDKTTPERPNQTQRSGSSRLWVFLLFFVVLVLIFQTSAQPPTAKYSDLETWLNVAASPGNRARKIVSRYDIELVTIDQQTNHAVVKFRKDDLNPVEIVPVGSKTPTDVHTVQVVIPDSEGTSDLKKLLDGREDEKDLKKFLINTVHRIAQPQSFFSSRLWPPSRS